MPIRLVRTLVAVSLLLLSAEGARAADDPVARELPVTSSDAGMCPVQPRMGADRAEMLARLAAKLREGEAAQGPSDVVVLNGRGYRYESDRMPQIARELQVLEAELQRAKAAARREAAEEPKP